MEERVDVQWVDLLRLSKGEVAVELLIALPWLAVSLVVAAAQVYVVALGCSFMFFLTGLRQVHNAFHYAIGITRPATHAFMFVMSLLMLGSMHAVQINHLRHHRMCLQDGDIEAIGARLPWWQAVLIGPIFPVLLHCKGLNVGTSIQRVWVVSELVANVLWVSIVFVVLDVAWLRYHVLAMAAGQCLTAFFAVWTVHHGSSPEKPVMRTVRGKVIAALTYNMFFHAEHHMFPAVPTRKLCVLAGRLDAVAPHIAVHRVFRIRA